jgi:pyruvate formate lyase activating enzyme
MNYGKSVHPTQETIETEAVNHFAPGAGILSCGNVGCMMSCAYCHNWKTSQAKYVQDSDIFYLTPEQAVETALRRNLPVISYTYNDPVVWHEWVIDTARLAQQAGLINLYKSAFYISSEAVDELLPYIDIFSISVKSMDPDYYRKYTAGRLEPVLEGARKVFRAGKHLELSTLMITGISDDEDTARSIANWVLTNLDSTVPLHYVRFHPDFKMRDTTRTPIPNLIRAREIAMDMGVEHVYVGNVYDTPLSNSYCAGCGRELVTRYGLNAQITGLDSSGRCGSCGRDNHFRLPALPQRAVPGRMQMDATEHALHTFDWHGDIRSLHVQIVNPTDSPLHAWYRRRRADGASEWQPVRLEPGESWRFIIAKASPDELGPEIAIPPQMHSNLHEVFDRAHFPTVTIDESQSPGDVSPLPIFPGQQLLRRTAGA